MSDTEEPRNSSRRPGLPVLVAVLLLLAATAGAAWNAGLLRGPATFEGTAYLPPEPAADFLLTDHRGQPATLGELRGRAVLVFFGFTRCPDVCPLTLSRLSRVIDDLDADTADLRVLLVTVDPARDTPAVLADYVSRFGPHVTGLTGDSTVLADVRRSFAAYAQHHTDPDHELQVSHTTAVFGIDREGQIRVLLPIEQSEKAVAADIRTLLRR